MFFVATLLHLENVFNFLLNENFKNRHIKDKIENEIFFWKSGAEFPSSSKDNDELDCTCCIDLEGGFNEVVKLAMKHIFHFELGNYKADFDNDGYFDILTLVMVFEYCNGQKSSTISMDFLQFDEMLNEDKHYQYIHDRLQIQTPHNDSDARI